MDLFEQYDDLPQNVKDVLNKFEEADKTYINCQALVDDLEKIGYTCDYGLDASPFDLKKL